MWGEEKQMMWKHICSTSKRVHFSAFRIFHLEVLKDPEENLSLESKQMATKGEQKNLTGIVGSLATPSSETSNDDDDTAGKGPGKGLQPASLPSPSTPDH